VDDKESIAACLEDVAEVVAQRTPAWAARLWGWAQAMREVIARPFSPDEYLPYKRSLAATRAHLGKQAFVAAWDEGRTMTLEQVLVERTSLPTPITAESASAHPAMKPIIFPAGLTTREVEVLRLVAQGYTDAQVAEQLVISPHTVNAHLKAIYGKIGVSSRSAATRYAVEQHLM
jgi:DNA-binding NarL/FixJ family response regulator